MGKADVVGRCVPNPMTNGYLYTKLAVYKKTLYMMSYSFSDDSCMKFKRMSVKKLNPGKCISASDKKHFFTYTFQKVSCPMEGKQEKCNAKKKEAYEKRERRSTRREKKEYEKRKEAFKKKESAYMKKREEERKKREEERKKREEERKKRGDNKEEDKNTIQDDPQRIPWIRRKRISSTGHLSPNWEAPI